MQYYFCLCTQLLQLSTDHLMVLIIAIAIAGIERDKGPYPMNEANILPVLYAILFCLCTQLATILWVQLLLLLV